MRTIYTTEIFRVPEFFRIMCYVTSVLMLVIMSRLLHYSKK
ncbi:hypothetical protein QFZ51_004197 [Chitinophaga sp. W3I9]